MAPLDRVTSANGIDLWLREWPNPGPLVLLIHGFSSNARVWNRTAAKLSEAGYHVVAPDLRGHGKSSPAEAGFDMPTLSRDMAAVLDQVGREAIVVGHSLGGNIAVELASEFPEKTLGLVLVAGGLIQSAEPQDVCVAMLQPSAWDFPLDAWTKSFRGYAAGDPDAEEWIREYAQASIRDLGGGKARAVLSRTNYGRICEALCCHRPLSLMPSIRCPVVVCAGAADETPVRHWLRVSDAAALTRDFRVVWFEGAGHWLPFSHPVDLAERIETLANEVCHRTEPVGAEH